MRFYSDERKGSRKHRYIAAQSDCGDKGFVAVKTAEQEWDFTGTWVYLTKNQALKLAGQLLFFASTMED